MSHLSSHSLFCDETGNTGKRFLDPAQPVFAEGGWFIAHKDRPRAMNAIEELERKYTSGARELKGAELIKKGKGQSLMRNVCESVGRNGGVPFIYVVEKRYAVCTKIVETYFDSDYNPTIATGELWDPARRQNDAQFFYDQGGTLIDDFAEAYRCKDPIAVKRNAVDWVGHLKAKGFTEQAGRVAGVLPQIEAEILCEAQHLSSGKFPAGMDSLNLPIIAAVFQFVEQKCPYPCDVVHDETASFEPVYKYTFDMFKNASPGVIEMKDGRRTHTGFENVLSLSFAESKAHSLIRAADYALAGARTFIRLTIEEQEIPPDITRIAFCNLGGILLGICTALHPSLGPSPELGTVMASNQWVVKVFNRLHVEFKRAAP